MTDQTRNTIPDTPCPSRSVCRRLAEQVPEEMAEALRAVGWMCEPPLDQSRDARARGKAWVANERRRKP